MSTFKATYRADLDAPRRARVSVGEALLGEGVIGDEQLDVALLVVSELVTNAVVHAGSDTVEVSASVSRSGAVRVEVADDATYRPARRVEPTPGLVGGGWGLRIVDASASDWGTAGRGGWESGKVVWAELPVSVR